jgi:hypothetical protein
LLLAFSSTLTISNLTTHAGESGGPNAGAFAYYRYRIAHKPSTFEIINSFEAKFKRVLSAKKDVEVKITEQTILNAKILKGTATYLSWIKTESIDYIYKG